MIDCSRILDLVRSDCPASGKNTDRNADIDVFFELAWRSGNAVHTDCQLQRNLNLSQDFFPQQLDDALVNRTVDDRVTIDFDAGQLIAAFAHHNFITVDAVRFKAPSYKNIAIRPALGRFYPKRFIAGINGIQQRDMAPMRVTAVGEQLEIDLNHPLAYRDLSLTSTVIDFAASAHLAAGGLSRDIGELVTSNGPGMQARWQDQPTDFWSDEPFRRSDELPDREFYARPRLVSHIDANASIIIGELYRQWIADGSRVLDLMASWDSHLPDSLDLSHLTGLGMNEAELAHNKQMDDYVVQDLNNDIRLPFEAEKFDAVICAVSVEYLARPLEVFAEVARVLNPGGRFIVTFSNRWFPPKSILVWEMLHEYERMGLVLEYFLSSGLFTDLRTWSLRGMPRPKDDKYADRLMTSDPVYAVCATRSPAPDRN